MFRRRYHLYPLRTLMTLHEELRGLLAAEALGALDAPERAALLVHLAECRACAEEVAELREAAGALVHAAPIVALDPARAERIRSRLLARAAAERRPAPRSGWGRRVSSGLGWATAAGLATLLLTHHSFHRPLDLGWVAAAVLGVLLFVVGSYAAAQRRELRALREERGGAEGERPSLLHPFQERHREAGKE
jgi:anti-sigma factor RsiW